MCYTCGCKRPYDTMGEENNIVESHFEKAGGARAIGHKGIVQAKKNMLELLKSELEKEELEKPKERY